MTGAKAMALLLIMSMLSACSGGARPQIDERFGRTENQAPETYSETVEANVAKADIDQGLPVRENAARADDRHRDERYDDYHHHHEPSPEAQHAAEAALILTGSAFLCTFVVVVLNGSCHFGVGFGYHYY